MERTGRKSRKGLGLKGKDFEVVRRERIRRTILYAIIGMVVALIAFIIGFLVGRAAKNVSDDGGDVYPYSAIAIAPFVPLAGSKGRIVIMLLAIQSFLVGLSAPSFGQSVRYGVFRGKR